MSKSSAGKRKIGHSGRKSEQKSPKTPQASAKSDILARKTSKNVQNPAAKRKIGPAVRRSEEKCPKTPQSSAKSDLPSGKAKKNVQKPRRQDINKINLAVRTLTK